MDAGGGSILAYCSITTESGVPSGKRGLVAAVNLCRSSNSSGRVQILPRTCPVPHQVPIVGSKAQRCNSFRRAVAKIPSWKISRLFLEARCLFLRFHRANATQNLLVRDWINPCPRLLWLMLVGVWPDRQTPDLRSHSQKHTHTTEKKASQHPVFWTLLLSRNRVSKPASP